MKKKKVVSVLPWVPRVIELGVHYCEEPSVIKLPSGEWSWTGKVQKFFYAYDLTGYHVASGPTAAAAIDSLIKTLWGTEIIAFEKSKEGRVERDPRRFAGEIKRLRRELKKWQGHVVKKLDWRMWLSAPDRAKLRNLDKIA
jgi:hypothetical protein